MKIQKRYWKTSSPAGNIGEHDFLPQAHDPRLRFATTIVVLSVVAGALVNVIMAIHAVMHVAMHVVMHVVMHVACGSVPFWVVFSFSWPLWRFWHGIPASQDLRNF